MTCMLLPVDLGDLKGTSAVTAFLLDNPAKLRELAHKRHKKKRYNAAKFN